MKKKHVCPTRVTLPVIIIMMFILLITVSVKADAKDTNIGWQNYSTWSSPVYSYIVPLGDDGSIMCFYGDYTSDSYVAQYYNSQNQRTKMTEIDIELPIFGAFYSDENYYYILSGQTNYEEDDSVEVFRLTKYTKDWNRISSTGLYGANTYIPFDAGSARIDHDGHLLFIRTCHEMYASDDGYHHQANVTIEINTDTMKVVDSYYGIMNISYGYVSHSFNQFIKLDNGYMVGVDHGDAHPRSVVLAKYRSPYSDSGFSKSCNHCDMLSITGETGANATGVSVGGFEISSDHYLVAGNSVQMGDDYNASGMRNIFVSSVSRDLTGDPVVNYITDYDSGEKPSTPQFVKLDDNRFLLLWMKDNILNYIEIDKDGNPVGQTHTMDGQLSDCKPVLIDGKIRWYTLSAGRKVTLYSIDLSDIADTESISQYLGEDNHTMKECEISLSPSYYYYDSTPKTPEVTVDYYGEVLEENKDYSVTYSDNVNAGTATATIHGIGEYSGSAEKTFTIYKASQSISRTISAYTIEVGGTATLSVSVKDNAKVTFSSSDESIATIDEDGTVHGLAEGSATLTITAAETGNYRSAQSSLTVNISKDIHSMVVTDIIYADETNNMATVTKKCSVCGLEETTSFTTMDSINYVFYWTGNSGSSYISSNQSEGDTHHVSMGSYNPSDAENQEIALESSDTSIMTINGTYFTFVGTGTVQLTTYAKYRPSVKITKTFTVSHVFDEGETIKAATCAEKGQKRYKCTVCGEVVTEETPLDPENHAGGTYLVNEKQATCGQDGYTGDICCKDCDAVLESGSAIAASGEHTYDEGVVTKEASCKEEGIKTFTCTRCQASYTEAIPKTTEHTWNNGDVTKEATEEEEGVKTYTCTVCGETKTEVIPILEHTHKYTEKVVAPTCTEKGYTLHTCKCGDTYQDNETEALGHDYDSEVTKDASCKDEGIKTFTCTRCQAGYTETIPKTTEHTWNNGEVTKEATEEEEGVKTYTCTVCGETKTEVIPALTHEHQYTSKVIAPTCTEKGYTLHTCKCGDTYQDNEVAALGHDYEGKVTKEASCKEEGIRTFTCTRCQDSYTETIPKTTEHTWNNGEVTKEATEEEEGVRTYTCTVCGETKTEAIPILEHTHKYTEKVVAPTCTEKGYTLHTCKCGDTYQDNELAALGHDYEGEVTKEASCKEEGIRTFTCTRCQDSYTEIIPKTDIHVWDDGIITKEATPEEDGILTCTCTVCGLTNDFSIPYSHTTHTYTDKVVDPTCTEKGYTIHTCDVCGYSYIDGETEAPGHTWSDWSVVKESTTTEAGLKKRTCSVCGYEETEVIPKTSSDPSDGPDPSGGNNDQSYKINATNFPDKIFRSYVSSNFDKNKDGTLSIAEVNKVTEINVYDKGISNLKGIEIFKNLTELFCEDNKLSVLDLSKNTKLKKLFCSGNQLKALDISNNPALEYLDCSFNEIKLLDISKNPKLMRIYRTGDLDIWPGYISLWMYEGSLYFDRTTKVTPKFTPRTNPMKTKAKVAAFKYAKVKKKAQAFTISKYVKISNAQGKVTYVKVGGTKKISLNSKTKKIKIKKGLKKGKYKIKIKVTATGNSYYKPISKVVTLIVKIK